MRLSRLGDIKDRFFSRVDKEKNSPCWEWIGTISSSDGYGRIAGEIDGVRYSPPGHAMLAHRASWILHFGQIPDIEGSGPHGTVVRHKCDNRKCVNPAHLELGTQNDNIKDMEVRGGANRVGLKPKFGTKHPNSVLTAEQAEYIISSTKTNGELAAELGVSKHTIKRARCGKTGYADAETAIRLQAAAKLRKGLSRPGVKSPSSKLTEQQVAYIKSSPLSTYKVAAELGLHQTTVARARRGATYKT